jgi:tRNA-specific 2-thiouridylase
VRNAVIVGEDADLFAPGLIAAEASFLSGRPPSDGARISTKIRYRSPAVPATYSSLAPEGFTVRFDAPQRAVTPGQIAALYDGDRLLGGGTIAERLDEG